MDTPGDYRELGFSGTEGAGVAGNGSLVISRVSRDHAGFYLCQASNGIGPGLSKLIRLTVHGKIFTQHDTSYSQEGGYLCQPANLGFRPRPARSEILQFRGRISPPIHTYVQGERLYRRRAGEEGVLTVRLPWELAYCFKNLVTCVSTGRVRRHPFAFTRSIVILKTFALLCTNRGKRYDAIHARRCGVIGGRGGKKKKELDFRWEISMVSSRFDSIASIPGRVSLYDIADFSLEHNVSRPIDRTRFRVRRYTWSRKYDRIFLSFFSSSYFWRSPEKRREKQR